jgi:2-C-methyl-D-erythritol 4-phosphate cytidylyltransferase
LNLNSGGAVVVVVDDAARPGLSVVVVGSVGRTATHTK